MAFGGGFPTSPNQATSVVFDPTTPGDWSPDPTTVGGALDQLAARVTALESGTSSTPETSAAALAIGVSVYRNGSNRMAAEDGSYNALRDAFAGFTTSAAAGAGLAVYVAANGDLATGLAGLTVGGGYYVSAGVLMDETALAIFVANLANSGKWYRFVGTANTTTSIKQAWGEPQQVP